MLLPYAQREKQENKRKHAHKTDDHKEDPNADNNKII